MATNPKEYQKEYMKKRRATEQGKQEALEISIQWRKENPEAYKVYNRERMRKKRAAAKGEGEKI